MEIKITSDSNNALLGRREVEFFVLEDDVTPDRIEVKRELCKKLNMSPDSTIIVKMDQSYGARQAKGAAHSYSNAETMKKLEPRYLFERIENKAKKAAKKAAEGGGEAAPAPKEEKKPEKKEKQEAKKAE